MQTGVETGTYRHAPNEGKVWEGARRAKEKRRKESGRKIQNGVIAAVGVQWGLSGRKKKFGSKT